MTARLVLLAALLAASGASAQVTVQDAWVRATVPAQKTTGAFMTLTSPQDAKVVAVSTPVARQAEIHESMNHGGVMHMHAVEALALPAGKRVDLKPGGFHVMLMGVERALKEGEVVPILLTIEGTDRKRTTVEVKASVRPLGAR